MKYKAFFLDHAKKYHFQVFEGSFEKKSFEGAFGQNFHGQKRIMD